MQGKFIRYFRGGSKNRGVFPQNGSWKSWKTLWTNGMIWGENPTIFGNIHICIDLVGAQPRPRCSFACHLLAKMDIIIFGNTQIGAVWRSWFPDVRWTTRPLVLSSKRCSWASARDACAIFSRRFPGRTWGSCWVGGSSQRMVQWLITRPGKHRKVPFVKATVADFKGTGWWKLACATGCQVIVFLPSVGSWSSYKWLGWLGGSSQSVSS